MSKEFHQAGAWAVIYCTATGKFLLGKRSQKVNKGGAWNLFGGRVDCGERPREALARELDEEAGLTIKPRLLAKLHSVNWIPPSGQSKRSLHYYILKADFEFSPRLNREHSDFRWFSARQLPAKLNGPTRIAMKNGLLARCAS